MASVLFDRFEPGVRSRHRKTASFTIDDIHFDLGELSEEQRQAWASWITARQDAELARLLELFERDHPQEAEKAASLLAELENAADDAEVERARERLSDFAQQLSGSMAQVLRQALTQVAVDWADHKLGIPPSR